MVSVKLYWHTQGLGMALHEDSVRRQIHRKAGIQGVGRADCSYITYLCPPVTRADFHCTARHLISSRHECRTCMAA